MARHSKNSKGVIAETYHELQALGILEKASTIYQIKKVSSWALIKAILQGTEICIQNLNELLQRIINDLNNRKIDKVAIKTAWFKDLNYLLVKLTNTIHLLINEELKKPSQNSLQMSSVTKLERMLKKADSAIRQYIKSGNILQETFLEKENLNNDFYKFLHDYRIIVYEITIWNKNINSFSIPSDTTYETFIGLELVTKAVNEPKLKGDTFFTQFRCLHQIPEVLTVVVNNYLEQAINDLKKNDIVNVHKNLRIANILFEIALDSLRPIIDNLSHNDYHEIRENLGLTSGSHSTNIHFHLFRDLYGGITSEYMNSFFFNKKNYKALIEKDYTLKLVEVEILNLRNLVNQWRNLHLHLPRINLGENKTKSLIGANEAVESVRKMQNAANSKDPLNPLVIMYSRNYSNNNSSIVNYIEANKSFDKELGKTLGSITQKRFSNVQHREGFFAKQLKFKNPLKRKV